MSLSQSYWLTRVLLLRSLAFVNCVAFAIAFFQNEYLIGDHGLTPARYYLKSVRKSILGASEYDLSAERDSVESLFKLCRVHPTLFWIVDPTDTNINLFAVIGMVLSIYVFWYGKSNVLIQLTIWIIYISIVYIGQTWYSFGWEHVLLEATFLSIFMVPFLSPSKYPSRIPTPFVALFGYRWLLFRIMFGSGLIKLHGDACWRDLTCMNYHYQTQPNPHPLSPLLHSMPSWFHTVEVLVNHVIELLFAWMLLMPRVFCKWGAMIMMGFQFILILSGNLSFLNWLTIATALSCFDDQTLGFLFLEQERRLAQRAENEFNCFIGKPTLPDGQFAAAGPSSSPVVSLNVNAAVEADEFIHMDDVNRLRLSHFGRRKTKDRSVVTEPTELVEETSVPNSRIIKDQKPSRLIDVGFTFRRFVNVALAVALCYLSIPVLINMFSSQQAMNTSFGPFKLLNSYGAYGSVTQTRSEVVIQGTLDAAISPTSVWHDYEFYCKPGNIDRRPCLITPYHLRLDWLMWFAAFKSYHECPWLIAFMDRLLHGDRTARGLLAHDGDPFRRMERDTWTNKHIETRILPAYVRAMLYEYEFEVGSEDNNESVNQSSEWERGVWWRRRLVREYVPPIEADNLSVKIFLHQAGLLVDDV